MQLLQFHFKNQNRPLEGALAKRDVCRGSSVSTAAKFMVALDKSAPTVGSGISKRTV